jgi:hypothetical protein
MGGAEVGRLARVQAVRVDESQASSLYVFVRTRFLIPLKPYESLRTAQNMPRVFYAEAVE